MIALVAIVGGLGIPIIALFIDDNKRKSLHAERMALIEKGIDPKTIWPESKSTSPKVNAQLSSLMLGMLLVGVGVGLLSGYFIAINKDWNVTILMNGMGILCGGLSLLLYNFIKGEKSDKKAA